MSNRLSVELQTPPVGHTCPLIDYVIERVNSVEIYMGDVVNTLEAIRNSNAQLRGWGQGLLSEYEYLESRYEEKEKELRETRKKLEDVLSVLGELEGIIKRVKN